MITMMMMVDGATMCDGAVRGSRRRWMGTDDGMGMCNGDGMGAMRTGWDDYGCVWGWVCVCVGTMGGYGGSVMGGTMGTMGGAGATGDDGTTVR